MFLRFKSFNLEANVTIEHLILTFKDISNIMCLIYKMKTFQFSQTMVPIKMSQRVIVTTVFVQKWQFWVDAHQQMQKGIDSIGNHELKWFLEEHSYFNPPAFSWDSIVSFNFLKLIAVLKLSTQQVNISCTWVLRK